MPRIATATVVFIPAVYNIEGIRIVLDMTLAIVLYSIILSSLVITLNKWFISDEKKNTN